MTTGQADALQRLWPKWGLDIDGQRDLDLAELFGGERPVVLEIGFGMGEATAQMAADDPETGILAVDVHTPGQGNLLNLADQNGLTNIRVANGDAIILLREMLTPDSLERPARVLPRPLAQEAAPQAAADPAGVPQPRRGPPRAGRPRALRDRLGAVRRADARSAERTPGLREHPAGRRLRATSGRSGPLTRFEGQGLDKGHVVNDLLFRRVQHRDQQSVGD